MTATLPETQLLSEWTDKPRCSVRLQVTADMASWRSWPQCPRDAVWIATARCPMGHVNTDLVCEGHKQRWDGQMFCCNTCSFTAPHAETEWRLL